MKGLANFIGMAALMVIGVAVAVAMTRVDDTTIYLIVGIGIGGVCFMAGGIGLGVLAANYFGWGTHRQRAHRDDTQINYQAPMQIRRPDEMQVGQLPAPRRTFYMIGSDGAQSNTSGDIEVEVE